MFDGLLELPWWGYVVVALVLTHITIAAVTLYLHRCQTHLALELHPAVCHFFRFWLWLTTDMKTMEWVAIHRKHHARVETDQDPHSPVVKGINRVLWGGWFLYRNEATNKETLEKYGGGTPDDWVERNVYSKITNVSIFVMLLIDVGVIRVDRRGTHLGDPDALDTVLGGRCHQWHRAPLGLSQFRSQGCQ